MANETHGGDAIILMLEESTYGTAPNFETGSPIILPDLFNLDRNVESIETGQKTANVQMKNFETESGREVSAGEISGSLAPVHAIILQGITNTASSPYVIANTRAPKSYTMIYYDMIKAVELTVALGVTIESLSLSKGTGSSLWQYTAGLRAKAVYTNQSTGDANFITLPAITCADWGDRTNEPQYIPFKQTDTISIGGFSGVDNFVETTVELTRTMMSDDNSFQQSLTRIQERVESLEGGFTFTVNVDTDLTPSTTLMDLTPVASSFKLTSGIVTWAFDLYGKLTTLSRPATAKEIFTWAGEQVLMGTCEATNKELITITVA